MPSLPIGLLVAAHMLLSLGGMLIHIRLHPVMQSMYYWWAAAADGFSLIVLPILFLRRPTVGWAYLFNALAVLTGVVGMAYYSLMTFEGRLTFNSFLTGSTLPFICILLAKLPIAHAILLHTRTILPPRAQRGCRP